jgi:hypothetical protein
MQRVVSAVDTRALPIGTVPHHAAYASYNGGESSGEAGTLDILEVAYCKSMTFVRLMCISWTNDDSQSN